jgi:hypothetical protein
MERRRGDRHWNPRSGTSSFSNSASVICRRGRPPIIPEMTHCTDGMIASPLPAGSGWGPTEFFSGIIPSGGKGKFGPEDASPPGNRHESFFVPGAKREYRANPGAGNGCLHCSSPPVATPTPSPDPADRGGKTHGGPCQEVRTPGLSQTIASCDWRGGIGSSFLSDSRIFMIRESARRHSLPML